VKKPVVIGILLIFVAFWMVEDADSLAQLTREAVATVWDVTQQVFTAIIDYLGSLVG
jgi:hypothetical protein